MTATQIQFRRGSAAQMATFSGAVGEVVVDTTNNRVVVHDGATAGGWPAAKLSEVLFQAGGRLTLQSATPVMPATQSAQATIYYTPYIHQFVPIYNGSSFNLTNTGGQLAQATTDATKSPAAVAPASNYDLFVWNDGGTIRCTRGPAWSSSTSRGTGASTTQLAQISGIWVNAAPISNGPGANLGTYVGTVRSNASSTIDYVFGGQAAGGLAGVIGVWNMYNRVSVKMSVQDSTSSWSYGTLTPRPSDNSTSNRISFVSGLAEDCLEASFWQVIETAAAMDSAAIVGVALDSTNSFDARNLVQNNSSNAIILPAGVINNYPPQLGFHFVQALEEGDGATAATFLGVSNGARMSLGLTWRA